MSHLRRFFLRLHNFLHAQRAEPDLARELASHLTLAEDEFRRRGMTPEEARLAARRALGGIEQAKELHRDERSFLWLEDLRRDVRHAARSLGRSPGFTTVVVLTLALGIGANTVIFSIVNSLLLRNLPVAEPERLVTISSPTAIVQGRTAGWTYPIWNEIRQRTRLFDGALAWSLQQQFNLGQGGEVEQVDGFYASGEFFQTLGVSVLMGRTFTPADDERGGGSDGPVAVISYRLWQRRFGGDAGVIGRPIVIERVPFTIIGVTPPEFFGAEVGPALVMPWIIGLKKARELVYFGDTIDAETALRLGMVNRVVPLAELKEATLKYARRLALIAPEALYAAKLAINRGADAGGFHNAVNAGLDIVAPLYAASTEVGKRFNEITRKEGLGAALRWRAAQFAE